MEHIGYSEKKKASVYWLLSALGLFLAGIYFFTYIIKTSFIHSSTEIIDNYGYSGWLLLLIPIYLFLLGYGTVRTYRPGLSREKQYIVMVLNVLFYLAVLFSLILYRIIFGSIKN